jgi:adenine phosphoribosyltransferase
VNLASYIREVPDFPIPGILFRDITPLLRDASAFREAIDDMTRPWIGRGIDIVTSIEARGFIFGAALARELGAGFVPVRKTGRLPWKTYTAEYSLEYRSDLLHIHRDAIKPGQNVLVVDDLIATGGTALAVLELVETLQGRVVGMGFLIELAGLGARARLPRYEIHSVISYEGD